MEILPCPLHSTLKNKQTNKQNICGQFKNVKKNQEILLLFNFSVLSDSLQPHGLQHTRLPCPSLSPRICSNSCPLSRWGHSTISSSVICFSCPQFFPASQSLPMSWLCIIWPEYWNFSLSPSNECSGLISFKIRWFDLLAVQETLKVLQHHA